MTEGTFPVLPSRASIILAACVLGSFLALGAAQAKMCDEPSAPAVAGATSPAPVLVELFTSEGCSSCPPADALLARVGSEPASARGEVIVLSEHVTYWNYLGWSDPYSTKTATDRQNDYARRFGIDGPYTPQMVVDGGSQFVGSDSGALRQALAGGLRKPRAALSVSLPETAGPPGEAGGIRVRLKGGSVPATARLIVVLVQRQGHQQVARGENGGRLLQHVSIAREFREVSLPRAGEPLDAETTLTLPHGAAPTDYRVVAFLQAGAGGAILASASTP